MGLTLGWGRQDVPRFSDHGLKLGERSVCLHIYEKSKRDGSVESHVSKRAKRGAPGCGKILSSGRTAPLKPKAGLSGPQDPSGKVSQPGLRLYNGL